MSFTSFKYDPARVKDRLNRATKKGRYYLNVPGPLKSSCYMEDPQVRLQGFAANNHSVVGGHPIDIDSDLSGRGRENNGKWYNIAVSFEARMKITTKKQEFSSCETFGSDQSRTTHPARNYRALEQSLIQPLYLNPQENVCMHFHNNINTRLLERDNYVHKITLFVIYLFIMIIKYITLYYIMEVAIPIIALGSMYVISNQNKEKKEGFVPNNSRRLPNTYTPPAKLSNGK